MIVLVLLWGARGECWGESPGRCRQSAHGTRRQDDHCGSEQAPCQQGSHLASTLNPGRYNLSMFLWTETNLSLFVLVTFVSHPPLDGKVWWMNFALSPVSPRQARTWESNLPSLLSLPFYCSSEQGTGTGTEWAGCGCGHLLTAGRQHIVVQLQFFFVWKHHLHFEHE